MSEKIKLSDHFTYGRLIRFVLPCIGSMLFTSIYGIVDGLFVSNCVGKLAFAAVNLILPYPMLIGTLGFMLGSGGSAIVAIALGAGDRRRANSFFSLIVLVNLVLGTALAVVGALTLRPVAVRMGAEGQTLDYCLRYGRILMLSMPTFLLQNVFQSFFVTAEKPHLGFRLTVAAGVTNMVLDALLVGALHGGVEAAAIATFVSQIVGGVLPLAYFARPNTSLLRFVRPKWEGRALRDACLNGSSELMTNLSMSLVNMLYNVQLMRLAGENGVAAYGVIMYANFLFIAVFVGYAVGSAPVVGFHYGARNFPELRNLYRKSLHLVLGSGLGLTGLALVLIPYVARFFVGYDPQLLALTSHAFRLYALSCVLKGFNIFASSFFTALGNGLVSGLIAFLRTLLFQVAAVLLLPLLLGLDGVWLSVTVAEGLALLVSAGLLVGQDAKYHYRRPV